MTSRGPDADVTLPACANVMFLPTAARSRVHDARGATYLLWTLGIVAFASAVLVAAVGRTIIDDSYISLSYARNLAFHLHWGLIQQRTSNTATSALNIVVLALVVEVVRNAFVALAVVFVAANLVIAYALYRTAESMSLPLWTAWLGTATLLFNPVLVSSLGMEVPLDAALLCVLLLAGTRGKAMAFGACTGLLIVTRVDLAIFALVMFAGMPALWRSWPKIAAIGFGLALPWFAWSWVALGSVVPATLILKLNQHWGGWSFLSGPVLYFRAYPVATVLSFAMGVIGVVSIVMLARDRTSRHRSWSVLGGGPLLLGIGGLLYYGAYSALDLPPYHWYYAPPVIALSVAGSFGVASTVRAPGSLLVARRPRVLLLALAVAVSGAQLVFVSDKAVSSPQPMVTANWATPAQYASIGAYVSRVVGSHVVVLTDVEIGTLAYSCDCALAQDFSDPGRLLPEIQDAIRGKTGAFGYLVRANFHFLDRSAVPLPAAFLLQCQDQRPRSGRYWRLESPWPHPRYLVLQPLRAGLVAPRGETVSGHGDK